MVQSDIANRDLSQIIKAYDVRGIYPDQLDEALAYAVGAAFVSLLTDESRTIVIGRDMRPSGPDLVAAFARGACEQGWNVIDIGLASTDGLYFASGHLGLPGAMFTASHNPARYNGIKLCRAGAAPVGQDSGLREISAMISANNLPAPIGPESDSRLGTITHQDLLAQYAAYLRGLVPVDGGRRLTVVVDAGNGMGGYTVPAVLGTEAGLPELPLDIVPMFFELDGTFPNHEANPIEPANLVDLQAKVREVGADLGLAFDGDADRCFVIDENGDAVTPSAVTALIASRELAVHPGSAIIHNLITSRSVPEVVAENGGTAIRSRVGHSFIKATMAETNAVFGGEHSGHFYFREFWRADSGMLAALHCIAALGETPEGTTFSSLMQPFNRYAASGEINTTVADQAAAIASIEAAFASDPSVTFDRLDGLTVNADTWWFNVRGSNTEPLLRLNAEAADVAQMEVIRDQVLAIMRTPLVSDTPPFGISAHLWEVLACPCPAHGELSAKKDAGAGDFLVCTVCNAEYPVQDGIPVMLPLDPARDSIQEA